MDTTEEIQKVSYIVKNLLASDVRTRNCDKYLTYLVMRHFTKIYIPFEDFNKIPAFETIKRTRAHIQNVEKLYPPTDELVKAKRQNRRKVFGDTFGATSTGGVR